MQSTLLLIQSPHTQVLGITVVTGDMWLREEVARTLRMLELIDRTDIPVVPGAEYPLVRTKERTELGGAIRASRVSRRLDPEDISPRGSMWLKDEVAHTLRMLELIGRTDIPVVPGAEYPLVRTKEETELWEEQYGRVGYLGAWTPRISSHPADQLGELKEGNPRAKPAQERCRAFPGAHGAAVPENPSDDLCRRPG